MPTTRPSSAVRSERAYIGAVLMGYARASDSGLRSDDFTDGLCRRVYAKCLTLEAQGRTADLVTVCDDMEDTGALIDLTGETSVDVSLVEQHCANIRTASMRREVTDVCTSAVRMAQDADIPIEQTVGMAKKSMDAVCANGSTSDVMPGTDAVVAFHEWLYDERREEPIRTGIPGLDKNLGGGMAGGKLIIVGARPAVGKSALLSAMALEAIRQGRRVLYVSMEMSAREIVSRMIASVTQVSAAKIEARTLDDEEKLRVTEGYAAISGDSLYISTTAGTPLAVRRAALRVRAKGGLDMVLVDYLQLMHADGKANGRAEEVGEISRALKLLAMELHCPVVAAAQVNRASTQGEERAPRLSELRESGSIEQDADVVILMHRPNGADRPGGGHSIQLVVAKNRQGSVGKHELIFFGDTMRFAEVDRRYGE